MLSSCGSVAYKLLSSRDTKQQSFTFGGDVALHAEGGFEGVLDEVEEARAAGGVLGEHDDWLSFTALLAL